MLTIILIIVAAVALFFSIGVIASWHESVTKEGVTFGEKLKSTIKNLIGVAILGIIGVVCITAVFSDEDETEVVSEEITSESPKTSIEDSKPEKMAEVKQELEQAEEQVPEFSFTVNEFIRRYNQATQNFPEDQIAEKMREPIIVENKNEMTDGFQYQLTKADTQSLLYVTTSVNNSVRTIYYMVFIPKDSEPMSVLAQLLFRFSATIMAVEDPDMPPNERGERLKEIGVFKAVKDQREVLTRKNNVDYKVDLSAVLGAVTLSVKPSK